MWYGTTLYSVTSCRVDELGRMWMSRLVTHSIYIRIHTLFIGRPVTLRCSGERSQGIELSAAMPFGHDAPCGMAERHDSTNKEYGRAPARIFHSCQLSWVCMLERVRV